MSANSGMGLVDGFTPSKYITAPCGIKAFVMLLPTAVVDQAFDNFPSNRRQLRKLSVTVRSARRAPRLLRAEAGTRAAAPFPAPLSSLVALFLRFASDRFLLTKPNILAQSRCQ